MSYNGSTSWASSLPSYSASAVHLLSSRSSKRFAIPLATCIATSLLSLVFRSLCLSFTVTCMNSLNQKVGLVVAACGFVVGYAAIFAFSRPCTSSAASLVDVNVGGDNVFQAKDGHMIAVFLLDVFSCCVLVAAGFTTGSRVKK